MANDDHVSNFPPEWWNERRKRDYYVNDDGRVRLKPDSPTYQKLRASLLAASVKIEDDLCRKNPASAALFRARGLMYRAVTR